VSIVLEFGSLATSANQIRHVLFPVICLHGDTAVHNALGIIVGENKLWQGSAGGLFVLEATEWPQGNITTIARLAVDCLRVLSQAIFAIF